MRYLAIFLLCGVHQVHCGEVEKPLAHSRILDGTNVSSAQFPTVGEVGDAQGIFCTGTLIASDVVLCAGHCVADDNGKLTLADTAGIFRLGGVNYRTRKVVLHPTYRGFQGFQEGQFDFSLLFLEQSIANITPTPLYRKTPVVGTSLTIAGYGSQGTGSTGPNNTYPSDGTINFGLTPLDEVTSTFIAWNFMQGESNTAPGDSGGPAFITEAGVAYVAGVTSGGDTDGGFGDHSFDARVDAVVDWIDQAIAAGGTPPPSGNNGFSFTSTPLAAPNPAQVGDTVTLTCTVNSDAKFKWNFGDGTETDDAPASINHTFSANGSYSCVLTATRISDGSTLTGSVTVTIGDQNTHDLELEVDKGKFTVNFQNPSRSKLDVTLYSWEFEFDDKLDFQETVSGMTASVKVGDQSSADLVLNSMGRATSGNSSIRWNSRTGEIRYQLRGSDVADFLKPFGVTNADTFDEDVTVPFEIQVLGVSFAGDFTFFYSAVADKTGRGR